MGATPVCNISHQKDQIMVASTRSNSVHIHAAQQDALPFLQISYRWLHAEDIIQNVYETTTLLQQSKDLNIAQADTMIEELYLEWDELPPLSEDDYSQANPKHGAWKNDPSLLTSQAHFYFTSTIKQSLHPQGTTQKESTE
jgi:hypothetical protein